jgi:hypothetical protein
LAAACHFVASLPDYPHNRNIVQPPLIEYDVGDNALPDTIFKEPISIENGACVLPNHPGLGVELDPDRDSPFQRTMIGAGAQRRRRGSCVVCSWSEAYGRVTVSRFTKAVKSSTTRSSRPKTSSKATLRV